MKLLIGADFAPARYNRELFAQGDASLLVTEPLEALLKSADFRVFNLEVPLTDSPSPIEKCGPRLKSPTACAAGLKALGADLVTLANNHILDQGPAGLRSTCHALDSRSIAWFGAGENAAAAAAPYILEKDGLRVGFYACTEHEFSVAGACAPGANPFDPLYVLDHVRELKARCDYVVLLYHGGREEFRYPSPELRRVCRRLAEVGADLVLCQHSHCIGCQETWQGSTILYGQGNFHFDNVQRETWQTGLLVELTFAGREPQLRLHPLTREKGRTALAQDDAILRALEQRSEKIRENGALERIYRAHAAEAINEFYGRTLGRPMYILYRLADKLTGGRMRKLCYSRRDMFKIINLLQCESHRELFEAGLDWALEE